MTKRVLKTRSAGHLLDTRKKSSVGEPPTEAEAAVAIARAWLAKGGFHEDNTEDPDERMPERIEIDDADFNDNGEYFVTVRVFIPNLDIEHVIDGTHIDGIVVEGQQ